MTKFTQIKPGPEAMSVPTVVTENWCSVSAEAEVSCLRLSQRSDSAERVRLSSETSESESRSSSPGREAGDPSFDQTPALRGGLLCSPQSRQTQKSQKRLGSIPRIPSGTMWWARKLYQMTKPADIPIVNRHVYCISACTGASAESFVFQAICFAFTH